MKKNIGKYNKSSNNPKNMLYLKNQFEYEISRTTEIIKQKQIELSSNDLRHHWQNLITNQTNTKKLFQLYLHVPFCYRRCSNCPYYLIISNNEELFEQFTKNTIKELEFYKDVFKDQIFNSIYVGGGTPSVLNSNQIFKLFTHLFKNYNFKQKSQKIFEAHPGSLNEDKIKILKKLNFNKISIGVQSTNEKNLIDHNRDDQDNQHIIKVIKLLKKYDFIINVDIMAGMKNQSLKDVIKSLNTIMKYNIDYISLYRMNYLTDDIKKIKQLDNFVNDLLPFLKKLCTKYDYIYPNNTNNKTHCFSFRNRKSANRKNNFSEELQVYNDIPNYPVSLLGIGPSSRGHIFKEVKYKCHEYENIKQLDEFDPNKNIATGYLRNEKFELIQAISNMLSKDPHFSLKPIKSYYSQNSIAKFEEFIKLKQIKKVISKYGLVYFVDQNYEKRRKFIIDLIKYFNLELN